MKSTILTNLRLYIQLLLILIDRKLQPFLQRHFSQRILRFLIIKHSIDIRLKRAFIHRRWYNNVSVQLWFLVSRVHKERGLGVSLGGCNRCVK